MIESKIENLIEIEDGVMSNFDHKIDYEVAKLLKDGKHYSQYAGWGFCGYVYWDIPKRKFICEIWVYNSIREIIEYETLELVMKNVCENYGYN